VGRLFGRPFGAPLAPGTTRKGDGIWPLCTEHDARRNVGFSA